MAEPLLVLDNVRAGYGDAVVLDGISLTVPRGQSVAVVGRNGSGKTTLLALLERYYDPDQGRILIDGVDIRNVTRKSLRDQISIVTQDSNIFPGTIAENIAYGVAQANPSEPDSPSRRELRQRIEGIPRERLASRWRDMTDDDLVSATALIQARLKER